MEMKTENHQSFKLSLQAIILNDKKEILILKSKPYDVWLLPGGRVDVGETDFEEALKRELKEELSVNEVKVMQPLGTALSDTGLTVALAFLCEVLDMQNMRLKEDEHTEFRWVKKEELEDYLYHRKLGIDVNKYLN
jgi:8-oxo-dGTP pyrophosphatase MutT (NUDIX family)